MAAITMRNIVKKYGDGYPAVNDVSLDMEEVAGLGGVHTGDDTGNSLNGRHGDDTINGGLSVDVSYGTGFYLPNTVGSVLLFSGPGPSATLIDQVRYMVFQEWDWFETGKSIERVSPESDGTLSSSWKLSTSPYGTGDNFGTPGF